MQLIEGLRGELYVTFEEGTWATSLYDLLKPRVTKVAVCNPRAALHPSARRRQRLGSHQACDGALRHRGAAGAAGRSRASQYRKRKMRAHKSYLRRLAAIGARYTTTPKAPIPVWLLSEWRRQAEQAGVRCNDDTKTPHGSVPSWLLTLWRAAGLTSTRATQ